jgi:hypothetical protein
MGRTGDLTKRSSDCKGPMRGISRGKMVVMVCCCRGNHRLMMGGRLCSTDIQIGLQFVHKLSQTVAYGKQIVGFVKRILYTIIRVICRQIWWLYWTAYPQSRGQYQHNFMWRRFIGENTFSYSCYVDPISLRDSAIPG